jgi:hypothetical protein
MTVPSFLFELGNIPLMVLDRELDEFLVEFRRPSTSVAWPAPAERPQSAGKQKEGRPGRLWLAPLAQHGLYLQGQAG